MSLRRERFAVPLMLTDALLAIAHHLLVFALPIALTMEIMLARPGIAGGRLQYLARIDMAFGIIAGAIVVVGIARVFYGLRGPGYYAANEFFWAKMAAFVVMGLLSIRPTIAIIRWRAQFRADPAFVPPSQEVIGVLRTMHGEAMIFAFIPIFAALMARYGS
jgi:putative membrane protein